MLLCGSDTTGPPPLDQVACRPGSGPCSGAGSGPCCGPGSGPCSGLLAGSGSCVHQAAVLRDDDIAKAAQKSVQCAKVHIALESTAQQSPAPLAHLWWRPLSPARGAARTLLPDRLTPGAVGPGLPRAGDLERLCEADRWLCSMCEAPRAVPRERVPGLLPPELVLLELALVLRLRLLLVLLLVPPLLLVDRLQQNSRCC